VVNAVTDVSTASDSILTLREAIALSAPGDTITFGPGVVGTLRLTQGQLAIGRALTVTGPGARKLTISGNQVSRVFNISGTGNVVLNGITIAHGRAPLEGPELSFAYQSAYGGGIYNAAPLTLVNCAIIDCIAMGGSGSQKSGGSGGGGGIFNTKSLTMRNCQVSGNYALTGNGTEPPHVFSYGGGIRSTGTEASPAAMNLVSTTIANNFAFNNGAGISTSYSTPGTLIACTISKNSIINPVMEDASSGVFAHGSTRLVLRNTLIAGNRFGSEARDLDAFVVSQGYNLVGNGDESYNYTVPTKIPWLATDLTGSKAAPLNPQLASLAGNGGPTNTMALLPSSAALDAGDDTLVNPPTSLSLDQRGYSRRLGLGVDIGAYERDVPQPGPNLVVNSTNDPGDGIAGVGECTLREALVVANSQPDANAITFSLPFPVTIPVTNTLPITQPVTITSPSARSVSVSGGNAVRVFDVAATATGVTLSGLTIRDGRNTGTFAVANGIGGVGAGGGIRNLGTLSLVVCSLLFNRANGGYASAVNQFDTPTGGPGQGGAIHNRGTLSLRNCTLAGNSATGGDAFGTSVATSGSGQGGAIYNFGNASLTNCTLSGNNAAAGTYGFGGTGDGAGLYNAGTATATAPTSTANLLNCTVTANRATGVSGAKGGGLYTQTRSKKSLFWNHIRLQNTLVALNVATTGHDLSGSFRSDGNNLVGKVDGSAGWIATDRGGTNATPLSPQLLALANNGGKTDTHALLSGSVAINAANASAAPTTDQRGAARSGVADIGAFEFGVVVP
jgi:hypothetical protein